MYLQGKEKQKKRGKGYDKVLLSRKSKQNKQRGNKKNCFPSRL